MSLIPPQITLRKQISAKEIIGSFLLLLLLCLSFSLAAFVQDAKAAGPTVINFQGKVVNANGTNVADSTYTFTFRLYNTASPTTTDSCAANATCLWEETQGSVTVTSGVFRVELGTSCSFFTPAACNDNLAIDFTTNALYLTLKFNNDAQGYMSPTIHFTSVPYAFNSEKLGGLTAGNFVQLAQGVQTDTSATNPSIFINKTGATVNILQLQKAGVDVLSINNSGLSTFSSDVDLTLAGTENLVITNTTASNNVDLFSLTLTNSDGAANTQRGIVLTNANDAANATTEALISVVNAEDTGSTLTDGLIISGTAGAGLDTIVDAIDVSDDNITNAINIGTNFLVASTDSINDFTGDGLTVTSNALTVRLDSTAADGSTTSSVSGLELVGGELSLIRGCGAGELLKWDNTNFEWDCAADVGAGASPFTTTTGTISQTTSTDQLNLVMGEAGDYGLKVSTSVAPTVDLVQIVNGNASATDGVDGLKLDFTTSNADGDALHITASHSGDGSDTYNVINVDGFTATTSAGTDVVNGLLVGNLTEAGAGAITSTALNVGTGWDTGLSIGTATTGISIAATTDITSSDTNGSLTLTANGSGNVVISGDSDTGLVISGATTGISTGTDGNLTIIPNGTGDTVFTVDTDTNVQISGTIAPSAGGTQNPFALNLTNAPTSTANTLNGLNIAITDATALANTVRGLYIDLSGVSNSSAIKVAAAFNGGSVLQTTNGPSYKGGGDATGSTNSGTGNSTMADVAFAGRYAYITRGADATACSVTPGSAIGCELQVYDVSNPASPTYVGGADASGSTNSGTGSSAFGDVAIAGRYAYIAKGGSATACSATPGSAIGCEFQVYDISKPTAPTYVGGADVTGSTNSGTGNSGFQDIKVSGRYAYLIRTGDATACSVTPGSAIGCEMQVYDVSNPASPTYVGGADASGSTNAGTGNNNFFNLTVSGRYVYITKLGNATACSVTPGSAIGCEMQVYDVSNPASPTYVGGADASGSTNSGTGNSNFIGVSVSGRYGYISKGGDATACSGTPGSAIGCELQIYDVSNPSTPTYVGGADASGSTNSGTGNNGAQNITTAGTYAYVAFTGNATACSVTPGSAIGCEMQVYDVSNSAAPNYVGGADASGSTNSGTGSNPTNFIAVSGRYGYAVSDFNATACSVTPGSAIGCELQVYDLSGVEATSVTAGSLESGILSVRQDALIYNNLDVGNGLIVGTGGIASQGGLSVTQTATPTTGGTQTGANFSFVNTPTSVANTFNGLTLTVSDATALANTIRGLYVDLSGVTNSAATKIAAAFNGGSVLQTTNGPSYKGGGDASGSTNSGTGLSDFNQTVINGRYMYTVKAGSATDCSTGGDKVGCELQIYDATNPGSPTYLGGADASGSTNSGTGNDAFEGVVIAGRYAYVGKTGNTTACSATPGSAIGCELQVYDISNPTSPTYVGGADASGSTNSGTGSNTINTVAIAGRYVYVGKVNHGTTCSATPGSAIGCELQVYDVSNPSSPTYVGGADSSGSTNSGGQADQFNGITIAGRYAYVAKNGGVTACSPTAGSAQNCELQVYDISNPSTPIYMGGADASGSTNSGTESDPFFSVVVAGRYAYVTSQATSAACSSNPGSARGCELKVFDISNPTAPTYVGGADASGSTNSGTASSSFQRVAFSGRYAYVAKDGSATACSGTPGSAIGCEIQVYDISNPTAPTYVGGADASGSTNTGTANSTIYSVTASGRYAHTAKAADATACSATPGSAIGCELQVYDVSGVEATSVTAGSLESGVLSVRQDALIYNSLDIGNSLSVGTGGIYSQGGLAVALSTTNSSASALKITPGFTGGATDALTYNASEIAAFSPTNASGTDIVNGLKIGDLTDPGATITSTALNIGTGWDNIFSSANASLTGAGALTVVSCSGCGGLTTVAYSGTPNANGGSISGNTLTLTAADGTNPGLVNTTAQIFGGAKTFTSDLTFSGLINRPGLAASTSSTTETTTELTNADVVGFDTSIAIGTDGLPVISYHNSTDDDLNITKCGNASCSSGNTTTELSNADNGGGYSSIAIGTDGLPVISYRNGTDDDLNVTKCGNAACSSGNTTTELSNADTVGFDTSIAIGTDGLPVISYYNVTDGGELNITKCGNAACSSGNTTTELSNADNVGGFSSIAIGTDGLPVISYLNNTDDDINVTKCGNASCSSGNTTTELSNADNVGEYSSIAIGTDGLPVISHYNSTAGNLDLNVTKCGNASCSSGNTTTELSNADSVGSYSSIAIGTDGLPVISYRNATDGDLNVTKCGNASCSSGNTTTELSNADSVGSYSSIAIGTDGLPVISYYNGEAGNLDLNVTKCATKGCTSGSGTALTGGIDLGTLAAGFRSVYFDTLNFGDENARLSLDDVGNFHVNGLSVAADTSTIFKTSANQTNAFEIQNSAGTALFIADTANLINRPGLAASTTVTTETTTELSSADTDGDYASIAIGADGLPVISYHNANDGGELNVVKCGNAACSSGNTTTELSSADNVGTYASIAIGADGLPVISYHNFTDGDLNVVKCGNAACSSGNTTTEISDADSVGTYSSIAIGSDGLPVISHYEGDTGGGGCSTNECNLTITKCTNASCSGNGTTEIENADSVGTYSSIAIGTDGLPVISYYNATDGGELNVVKCGNAACSSGNTTTELTNADDTGSYSSIAIGTDGLPVISHRNSTAGNLDLNITKCGNAACSNGNTTTELSVADNVGTFSSIAIGTDGLPVISYRNSTDEDLNVTKCSNTACSNGNTTTELSNANIVSDYSSIAIGTDGLPVISYYNGSDGDLNVTKCATKSCATTTGTALTSGVDLGTLAAGFRSVYFDTLNFGDENARLSLDDSGIFRANGLISYDPSLGTTTNGVEINYTQGDDADATDTNAALRLVIGSGSADADTLYGINIDNITAGSALETGIRIGTGWDTAIEANGNVLIGAQADATAHNFASGCSCLTNSAAGTFVASTDINIDKINSSVVYKGKLFVATAETNSAAVYRYDGGTTWVRVTSTTLGKAVSGDSAADADTFVMTVFNGALYIGSQTGANTGAIYYSTTAHTASAGDNFTMGIVTRGSFTMSQNAVDGVSDLAVWNGNLYVSTQEPNAWELGRYDGGITFTQINTPDGEFISTDATDIDGANLTVFNNRLWIGAITGAATARVGFHDGVGTTLISQNATQGTFDANAGRADVTSMVVWNGELYVAVSAANGAGVYRWLPGGVYSNSTVVTNWNLVSSIPGELVGADATNIDSIILSVYRGRLYAGSQTAAAEDTAALYEYGGTKGNWTLINSTRGTFGAQTGVNAISSLQTLNGILYVGTDEGTNNVGSVYSWSKTEENSFGLRFDSGFSNYGVLNFVGTEQSNSNTGRYGSFVFSNSVQLSSGAFDYAEDYPTLDSSLLPGEPVAVDPAHPEHVKRAVRGETVLGVVSENPGFRLSSDVAPATGATWIPIALVGRVPVLVTTHNGGAPINPGDTLALSDKPGVLEKASASSGAIVGTALAGYSAPEIGKVSLYVNPGLQGYAGSLDASQLPDMITLGHKDKPLTLQPSDSGAADAFIVKDENGNDVATLDNQGNARFMGTITADKIKANQIEGLEILTDKISSLQDKLANESSEELSTVTDGSTPALGGLSSLSLQKLVVLLELNVDGSLKANAGLVVGGSAEFRGQTSFQKLVSFMDRVVFRQDVSFEGRATFNNDAGGFALIKKDQDKVDVKFDKPYDSSPIITVSVRNGQFVSYIYKEIKNEQTGKIDGFTIIIKDPAAADTEFAWTALNIKDPRTAKQPDSAN